MSSVGGSKKERIPVKKKPLYKEVPLSDSEIKRYLEYDVTIIPYNQITRYGSLTSLFEESNNVVLNYLQKPDYGHWTCLRKRGHVITYFDSYGNVPDNILHLIDFDTRKRLDQTKAHLSELYAKAMAKSKTLVYEYNEKCFQAPGRQTCGYWCCMFLKYPNSLEKFQEFIEKKRSVTKMSTDDIILYYFYKHVPN